MPHLRKLEPEEIKSLSHPRKGIRKRTAEEYDALLGEYAEGDYGMAEPLPDEKRTTIRNRLIAAAKRRHLGIEFKRTRGDILRFKIVPLAEESEVIPQTPARSRRRTGNP